MSIEQLSLLSHGLEPLALGRRVRVIAEGYEGVVAQINIPGDRYAVYAVPWRRPLDQALPIYRRDELEALPILDEADERAAVDRICGVNKETETQ